MNAPVSPPGSLGRLIALQGPITVARFMAEALTHPRDGYYMRADPLGSAGDFTTAPEISQMFGELIGLWCADCWRAMGAPEPVLLVELGPGRGTLMADALRAAATVPDFRAALDIHLVEASPALRARQEEALAGASAHWHDSLGDVPRAPMLLIANEFFDALPIHQFIATAQGWRERLVGLADDGFCFVLAPGATPACALIGANPLGEAGAVLEIRPAATALGRDIAERLAADGGAALLVDFDKTGPSGDSLQAVRGHRRHDVLADPGTADIAAAVDFAALTEAARGARVHGPVQQGEFLEALGLGARATALAADATPDQAADIESARNRLSAPDEMGTLFKALAITGPDMAAPAGFTAS